MPTSSDSVLTASGHATPRDQTRTFLLRFKVIPDSRTCFTKEKKKIGYQNVPRIRHECEKSLVTNCSLSEVSTAKWLSYFRIERRSTMSCYHGSKVSGSEQSFLTETAICIVERCKISMDYCFVPDCSHERKVMNLNFFVFFCPPYLQDHALLRSSNFATMATWRKNLPDKEA